MPHIVLKRTDISEGVLQITDLKPNTSQRNSVLDPPGQTKYVRPPLNETVVLIGAGPITVYETARGLAAWFVSNVNDGTGVAAAGSITIAAGDAAPGDDATVDASPVGGPSVLFTFVAGVPANSTEVQIGANEDATSVNLAAAINDPANGLTPYVAAAAPGGGPPSPVNITAVTEGTAGNTIAIAVTGANLSVSGATLAGGVDAGSLTAANANTIAANIFADLVRRGDLTAPAVAANLAAVNGIVAAEVATASITTAQLAEVLDILGGRLYVLPKGVQIDSTGAVFDVQPPVGATGGPGFVDPSVRHTYDTGSLKISVGEGQLSVFTSPTFVYSGVAGNPNGEAVVVYADDGSIYVP